MSKSFETIGYNVMEERTPGIWTPNLVTRGVFCEVYTPSYNRRYSSNQNASLTLSSEISFVADPFAINHYKDIAYITCYGTKWDVSSVRIERPRIIVTLGEKYNER